MEQPIMKNVCDVCGRGFNRIEKLNMHKKTIHDAKGNKFMGTDEVTAFVSDSESDDHITPKNNKRDPVPFSDGEGETRNTNISENSVEDCRKVAPVLDTKGAIERHSIKCMDEASVFNHCENDAIEPECMVEVRETRTEQVAKQCANVITDSCIVAGGKHSDETTVGNCSEVVESNMITESKKTIEDDVGQTKEAVALDLGKKSTPNCVETTLEPNWLVALKEKTEKDKKDLGDDAKSKTAAPTNCLEAEPSWLVALKEKTDKDQRETVCEAKASIEQTTANPSKDSAIEPACLIEVSDVALSIPVAEESVPLPAPKPEPKPAPVTPAPTTDGTTTYRRDGRLRKIIRPVKKLSYSEAYSDDLDDSDEKVSSGNNASSSKSPRVRSNKRKSRNHVPVQKDIKCPMCPEVFHDLRGIKGHILVHLNDDTQICEVCQEEIPDRQDLIIHLRGHVQVTYKCERCPSEFSKIGSFYHHRDKHLVEEDGYVYTCNICNKTLYNKWYLKEHKRKHNKKSTYICEVCGKMFSTKATLKAHLEAHTSVKHTCELCGKNYARRVGLLNHLRRDHEGIKKHECPDCGKKFFARKTLVQHMRIHTGEKPYSCDFCGKTFTQKINRDQHRRLHTGEQPYRCEYCFKCFSLRAAYTQHLRTHTGFKVSEMNPSVLQPQQNLSTEENQDDVENAAVQNPCDLSVHSTDHVK